MGFPLKKSTWKQEYAIEENTKISYNPFATLFMTFTLSGVNADRKDYETMNKQWNAYVTNVLRFYLSSWILVKEQHKDGAWHIHIIANLPFEIVWNGERDFQDMKNGRYARLCPKFRWLINLLRIRGYIYGFGYFNAEPSKYIGTKSADDQGKAFAHYLSSYASKSLKFRHTKPQLKGKRLVSYGKASPRSLKITILRLPPGVGSDRNKKGKRIAPIKTHYKTVKGPKVHLSYYSLGEGIRKLGIYNYWKWRAVAGKISSTGGGRRFRLVCVAMESAGLNPTHFNGQLSGSPKAKWGYHLSSVVYDPELAHLSPVELVDALFGCADPHYKYTVYPPQIQQYDFAPHIPLAGNGSYCS